MGFPIKKRIPSFDSIVNDSISTTTAVEPQSGLNLSAAIARTSYPTQQRQHHDTAIAAVQPPTTAPAAVMHPRSISESSLDERGSSTTSSSSPQEVSSQSTKKKSSKSTSNSGSSSQSGSSGKRSKTFPDILLSILSNPEYHPIVSWLPAGKSFAIHDPAAFSSEILPKYFRRVIFRSFIRKLNRWGFRSVKRSVSGFESTFEHPLFCRDEPELARGMYCKSNPTTRAPSRCRKSSGSGHHQNNGLSRTSSTTSTESLSTASTTALLSSSSQAVTPSNSGCAIASLAAAAAAAARIPQAPVSSSSVNEEFQVQLSNELLLRRFRQERQRALLSSLVQQQQQPPLSPTATNPVASAVGAGESDLVSQYIAERLQQMLLSRRQRADNELYAQGL